MDLYKNILFALETYLNEKDISASTLEKIAGIRKGTVRNILYGQSKNPTADTLAKLSITMNISIDRLVMGKDWEETSSRKS